MSRSNFAKNQLVVQCCSRVHYEIKPNIDKKSGKTQLFIIIALVSNIYIDQDINIESKSASTQESNSACREKSQVVNTELSLVLLLLLF